MKLPIHLHFIFLIYAAVSMTHVDALLGKYVTLISSVHDHYGTSSVFFISSKYNKSKERLENFTIFRNFSICDKVLRNLIIVKNLIYLKQ